MRAWEAVLDRLEADLALAESPEALTGSWKPPAGIGPLPGALADRAREIFAAQTAAIGRMRNEHATIARHTAAIRSIPSQSRARKPVYLDHSA